MMKISVAMAAYNGSKYIQEQLNSFCSQSRLPDELIVTDDCSTDNTCAIIEEFAKSAPFEVKLYRNQSRLGYTHNFSKVLSLCTGDLIFLSDQDDVWFENKINVVAEIAEKDEKNHVFMNNALITNNRLESKGFSTLELVLKTKASEIKHVYGCCMAIKANFLKQILPIPEKTIGHDNWILGFADMLNKRHQLPAVLQYYRRHNSNHSNVTSEYAASTGSKLIGYTGRIKALFSGKANNLLVDNMNVNLIRIQYMVNILTTTTVKTDFDLTLKEINTSIRVLAKQSTALKYRINLYKSNRVSRIRQISKMYSKGYYDYFNGKNSVLRDFIGVTLEKVHS